jgi:selenide, water dikinase
VVADDNVIRGMESLDNAGVYKLRDDLAIVQTVDFFTPIVNDPYDFGQIAVANSLSDVYTMGGRPITAMNIVCFPAKTLDISILGQILRGGADKMREAGVVLIGGHSVDDEELKYGLSVTATVHPDRLVTNSGARVGDRLILTKPLGTGILSTALKAGMLAEETLAKCTKSMATLNKKAGEVMLEFGVCGCTDVTGFGFLGHALQMATNSRVGMEIDAPAVPFFFEAKSLSSQGLCPGGLGHNRDFYGRNIEIDRGVPEFMQDLLFDPQTSGGLLISVAAASAPELLDRLHREGVTEAGIVGTVVGEHAGKIRVK